MDTTAIEAKDRSKAHAGPLRALHSAFHAFVITRDGLDNQLVRCAHLHHGCGRRREPSRLLDFAQATQKVDVRKIHRTNNQTVILMTRD
jgi:hypothetical protein